MTVEEFNENLASLKKGSKRAWREIYDEYYAFIYFTALSRAKNKAIAEDIASDVMIALSLPSVGRQYVKNPKTFLYAMTLNKIKNTSRLKSTKDAELSYDVVDIKSNFAHFSVEISDLLLALPPTERKIFVAHVFWGIPFNNIAKENGVSSTMVRRKYLKACEFLKEQLKDEF